jgi:NodT family efflux transporter outer membrane factor (OMF) lipoprotein
VGPDFHEPQVPVPADFRAAQAPAGAAAQAKAVQIESWWRALGDPQLDSLVDRALRDNLELDIALQRLQQARALEVVATGTALPRIGAASGGAHGTGSDLSRGRMPSDLGSADHTTSSASRITQVSGFDVAWDLDIFGRLRRQMEAARYDAQAAAAARDAVQVAVIADVVRGYVDLRGAQMQLAVLRQDVETAQRLLLLVQARYERGITNELDLTLARRQLASVQSQVPPLQSHIEALRYGLAVLLGRQSRELDDELSAPAPIPPVPAAIAPGLPLDLLRRRPDVREAEWEVAGDTARIGVATANLFPQLAINAGVGTQREATLGHPSSHQSIWSAGYVAYFPLLDFGVLDGLVDVADLRAREDLARYRLTVLHAVQEVDAAISAFEAEQATLLDLQEALVASQRAVELASQRYERGLTDFLNVVDAQRREYELEGQFIQAQGSVADQFVGVYRALGGGWEQYAGPPEIRAPQPALVAMFRRLVHPNEIGQ